MKMYNAQNLPPHIVRHSPTGMSCGYLGSGPADLALSLLTDVLGKKIAEKYYQDFKFDVVSKFDDNWSINEIDIENWYISKSGVKYFCGSCEKYFIELKDNQCPYCGSGNWITGCPDEQV